MAIVENTYVAVDELHTGTGEVLTNALVTISNGSFGDVQADVQSTQVPRDAIRAEVGAPGFIDLQINGAMDRQFTDDPTQEAVEAIVIGARRGGTAHVLPTFTTASGTKYLDAFEAIKAARTGGVKGILGMHLEGPFLNPKRSGIHQPENMRPIGRADLDNLLGFSEGKLLVTVAPECQQEATIRELADAGVVVFAGHSLATKQDIDRALAEGLRGVTHLFNAMSQLTGREPGLVGSAFSSSSLYAGIIADGHHVHYANISVATQLLKDRLFLVTDAMRSLEGIETEFLIQGKKVQLEGSKLADKNGTLAGAHIALDECVRNVIKHCGVARVDAIRMASAIPANAIGLGHELGRVETGYRASMTLLSNRLEARRVIVDGDVYS